MLRTDVWYCALVAFGSGGSGDLYARTHEAIKAFFADRRRGLIVFAALGILASPVELGFMLSTCIALVLSYILRAQRGLDRLLFETQPVCALLAAAGVWVTLAAIERRWGRKPSADSSRSSCTPLAAWCMLALAILVIPATRDGVNLVRYERSIGDLPHRGFRLAVDSLPGDRKIVFVRYAPGEGCQQNLIQNNPPLSNARSWIVNDRGADDIRLLRAAPDRVPYLFDAQKRTMQPLSLSAPPVSR